MKQRVITGVTGAVFALIVLGFMHTPAMGIVIAAAAALASYEIQNVAKIENKLLMWINIVLAAVMPLVLEYDLLSKMPIPTVAIAIVYIILMMLIMLGNYEKTKFEDVVMSMFCGIIVPFDFATMMLVRNLCKSRPDLFQQSHIFFIIFCALLCAWLNDTFAFFVGRKFGKHKLAPNISPKKSIEGAVGGIVITTLFCLAFFFIFDYFFFKNDTIKWWMVLPSAMVLCTVSICGDLSASVIKRNFGAKDFGNIFPGHGGIMDRFDSYSFVMPVVYAGLKIVLSLGA